MNKDEIIKLAIQAGIKSRTDEFYSEFCDGVYFDDLITFANLIAAKERKEWAVNQNGFAESHHLVRVVAGHGNLLVAIIAGLFQGLRVRPFPDAFGFWFYAHNNINLIIYTNQKFRTPCFRRSSAMRA